MVRIGAAIRDSDGSESPLPWVTAYNVQRGDACQIRCYGSSRFAVTRLRMLRRSLHAPRPKSALASRTDLRQRHSELRGI